MDDHACCTGWEAALNRRIEGGDVIFLVLWNAEAQKAQVGRLWYPTTLVYPLQAEDVRQASKVLRQAAQALGEAL